MSSIPVLSEERVLEIRSALRDWYAHQERKQDAAKKVGTNSNTINLVLVGTRRLLPPEIMANLWKETNNPAFLMTAKEKADYRRFMGQRLGSMPNEARWPNRETVGGPTRASEPQAAPVASTEVEPLTGLEDLETLLAIVHRNMERLAGLPAEDPKRRAAQKRLPGLVVKLYQQAVALGLDFPKAFSDLLGQFDLVTHSFREGR